MAIFLKDALDYLEFLSYLAVSNKIDLNHHSD